MRLLVCDPMCFCFSRFFCFFLWALGVTLFSPYGSCSPTPDSKKSVKRQSSGSSAQQYGIFSRLHYIRNIEPEYKWYPGWIVYQHQVHISTIFTAVIIESARRQTVCLTHSTFRVKGMIYIHGLSLLWEQFETAIFWKPVQVCYELSVQQEG